MLELKSLSLIYYFHDVRKEKIRTSTLLSRLIVLLLLLAGFIPVAGQHNLVLYNMDQVPQSSLLNPGKIPMAKAHLGVPLLSGIRVGAGNTGFSYNNFDRAIMTDAYDFDYLAGLYPHFRPGTNRLLADAEIQVINFGMKLGDGYLFFDVSDVMFASGTYDRESLNMFHDVQQGNVINSPMDTTNGGQPVDPTYDLSGHGVYGSYYRSYALGYAHQFSSRFSVGGRFRFLQGIASIKTENNGLMFQYPGQGDYFQLNGQMDIYGAGFMKFNDSKFLSAIFQGGNSGFAFDIGGVYQLNDKWEISASAVNLGQIKWKKYVERLTVDNYRSFSAVDIQENLDQWEGLLDTLVNGMPQAEGLSFTTPLPQRYFLGANYNLKPTTSIGLLVNPVCFMGELDLAVALSANTKIGNNIGLSGAIQYNRYRPINVGLGVSFDVGFAQLYMVTDNLISMFSWKNTTAAQAQLGINIKFGRMDREESTEENTAALGEEEEDSLFDGPVEEGAVPDFAIEHRPTPQMTAPAVNGRFFTLKGTARDANTGDLIRGANLEVYKIDQFGNKALVYVGTLNDGNFSVVLDRGETYELFAGGGGFENKVLVLPATEVSSSAAAVERHLALQKAVAVQPPANTAGHTPMYETRPEGDPGRDSYTPPQRSTSTGVSTYRLTASTSFRKSPDSQADVILRFRPDNEVVVLEKTNKWWWKVQFQGQRGYVKAQLLTP